MPKRPHRNGLNFHDADRNGPNWNGNGWKQTETAYIDTSHITRILGYVENRHHIYMVTNNVNEYYVENKPKRPHLYITQTSYLYEWIA